MSGNLLNFIKKFFTLYQQMATLLDSKNFLCIRTMLEDFWHTDKIFDNPYPMYKLMPAVNIRETNPGYELEVIAPGFEKEDFMIITENGLLTIKAESNQVEHGRNEDYIRKEFSPGPFNRTFSLPDNGEEDYIHAIYKNGMLKIVYKKSGHSSNEKNGVKVS
jgi:HSP20 family protein